MAGRRRAILDLIIIGGGINGTGIARDAAGRGLTVALFEQHDLGEHASSTGSKLLDGGLSRDALREREILRKIAPHIIWPVEFCQPDSKEPRARTGLFSSSAALPGAKRISLARHAAGAALKPGYDGALTYAECWVEDSRLAVLNAMDAAARGAKILPRVKFLSAQADKGVWHADTEAGMFSARAIINAAGPWVGEVLRGNLGREAPDGARLVKSSHIITKRIYPENHALALRTPDGRDVYVVPYERDYSLIGAAEMPYEGDAEEVAITEQETAYLCESVSRYFRHPVRPDDVLWTFSAVCARFGADDGLVLDKTPGTPPLLTVDGGSMTMYRKRAEQAVTMISLAMGRKAGAGWTANTALPGGDMDDLAHFERVFAACHSHLGPETTHRLVYSYGTRAEMFVGREMGEDFGAGLSAAEVDYLVKHEWARTAEDILWRRTKIGLHAPEGAEDRLVAYLGRGR